jgi:hypothetical protein
MLLRPALLLLLPFVLGVDPSKPTTTKRNLIPTFRQKADSPLPNTVNRDSSLSSTTSSTQATSSSTPIPTSPKPSGDMKLVAGIFGAIAAAWFLAV